MFTSPLALLTYSGGGHSCYISDPEGNRSEITWALAA